MPLLRRKSRSSGKPTLVYTTKRTETSQASVEPEESKDKNGSHAEKLRELGNKPVIQIGRRGPKVEKEPKPPRKPKAERSPKKPKAPKVRRIAPEGADLPTMGLPKLIYGFYKLINHADWVPKMSAKEERGLRRERSKQLLLTLSDQVPKLSVAYFGVKGLAATTATTVHTASVLADETRIAVAVSDFNPAQGSSAVRLGRDADQTITLRGLLRALDQPHTRGEFISRLRPTGYGVRVVSADSIIGGNQHLTSEDAKRMLDAIDEQVEYHHIDTANDITTVVSLEVAKAANVFVFTTNVAVRDSLRLLGVGMETLREHGFARQVDNSVVVISNIPKGKTLDDYRQYVNLVNIKHEVEREIPFHGAFVGIPHDPIIALDGVVDLKALRWETYQSYIDLNNTILKMALQLRQSFASHTAS